MKRFPSRILVCLSLLSSVALLSGCALQALQVGQKLAGIPGLGSTVTGWVTDQDGEIVAYCCNTSCAKAESVNEFQDQFLDALEKKVSDEKERKKVMDQVEFVRKPPVDCQANESIVFKVDYKVGGVTRTKSTTIKMTDLGSNGDTAARKDLKSTLEKFEEEFKNGAKLIIELTVCNGSETAQSSASTNYSCGDPTRVAAPMDAVMFGEPGQTTTQQSSEGYDADGDGSSSGNELEACLDCTPQPPVETEYKFDWSGIL
jgi:hypothetical protein